METKNVDWNYFNKFDAITDKYLPATGQGNNMAQQAVAAMCKLVFKWYNDGDIYDTTNYHLNGWANDLSSYANWLHANTCIANELEGIYTANSEADYEHVLARCADKLMNEQVLAELASKAATGSIYECTGCFVWEEAQDEDEDY